MLQPIADAIKLLLKEDIMPAEADSIIFWTAPFMVVLAAFTTFIVVPFGPTHAITDMNIGILFMLGVSSLSVLGIVMAGWASNSHYPLIGALRSSAQMVSYEVAMGMAVVSAVLMTSLNASGTGTLSMIGIVQAQQAQHEWFIFKFFPLGLIAFFIFAVAMVAETNRAPFDLAEAESELTAGFHTEYSGFRWSLFFLAEYSAMIAVSSIAVTLWLGGWLRPFPNALSGAGWDQTLLVGSRRCFSFSRRLLLLQHGANAEASILSECRRSVSPGSVLAGTDWPGTFHSCGSISCSGYFLVHSESCRIHVPLHLVSRHIPPISL